MNKLLLVITVTILFLNSCSCSRQTYHITSWQEPVFLNDTTLIVIGWEEDFKEPGTTAAAEYSNGVQTLYHYTIPTKELKNVKILRNNNMGSSDYTKVRLQYPWLLFASRGNDDVNEVALLNLETDEEEVFRGGEAMDVLFVSKSGRFVGYTENSIHKVYDRNLDTIVIKSTREIPFASEGIINEDTIFGKLNEWLVTYSTRTNVFDTLRIAERMKNIISSGEIIYIISDTGIVAENPSTFLENKREITVLTDKWYGLGSDINLNNGYYAGHDNTNVYLGNYNTNSEEKVLKGSRTECQ